MNGTVKNMKIICALSLVAAATVFTSNLRGDPATAGLTNASLLLVAATNTVSGPIATFVLSNGTPAHICCVPEAIERQTNGAWARMSLFGNGQRLTRKWKGVPEELQPKQAARFTIPAPWTNATWRLVFSCQEQRPVADRVADVVSHIKNATAAETNLRQFSGRRYSVTSAEVSRAVHTDP